MYRFITQEAGMGNQPHDPQMLSLLQQMWVCVRSGPVLCSKQPTCKLTLTVLLRLIG